MSTKPQLEFYCTRWGRENIPWETFIHAVKKSGHDGMKYRIYRDTYQAVLSMRWQTYGNLYR